MSYDFGSKKATYFREFVKNEKAIFQNLLVW